MEKTNPKIIWFITGNPGPLSIKPRQQTSNDKTIHFMIELHLLKSASKNMPAAKTEIIKVP